MNRTGLSEIHKIIIGIVNKYQKQKSKILDLGVGPGHVFKELQKNHDLYGIEIADEAFSMYDFDTKNIKKFDFSNGIPEFENVKSFDVIIASNILHHLKNPLKLLLEIKEKMNNNSILIFVTPNISFFIHRIKYFFTGKFPNFSKSHVNFLSPYEWIEMLKTNGFKIIEIQTMGRHKILLKLFPLLISGSLFFVCKKSK
jgi:2-polyprenyl-3-methyl-5-hydroxy-6-metoxy-1,4-benzoquinol methylase